MSIYTIGDLHLSLGVEKPMDVFGGRWQNYMDKLREGLSVLTQDDMLVLCGDTSWGMTLRQALPDFQFLSSLPCRKLLVKGNHDYWWETAKKITAFWQSNDCRRLALLHNNAHFYDGIALCGTRGWFCQEDRDAHSEKIFKRELQRLEFSLRQAAENGAEEIYCFLHYPPIHAGQQCREILEILHRYPVTRCYYGHLHGQAGAQADEGRRNGIEYRLVSSDHLHFRPLRIG